MVLRAPKVVVMSEDIRVVIGDEDHWVKPKRRELIQALQVLLDLAYEAGRQDALDGITWRGDEE